MDSRAMWDGLVQCTLNPCAHRRGAGGLGMEGRLSAVCPLTCCEFTLPVYIRGLAK